MDNANEVSGLLAQSPSQYNEAVFNIVRELSENVARPIGIIILGLVLCYELFSMLASHNNMHDMDVFLFFKWLVKATIATIIISNVFSIVNTIFDIGAFLVTDTIDTLDNNLDFEAALTSLENLLNETTVSDVPQLMHLYGISFFIGFFMEIVNLAITIILMHRFIIIYLKISVAHIPFATMVNREWGSMGNNYLKTLFAVAFQAFFMMVCIAIYGALMTDLGAVSSIDEIVSAIWLMLGYGVLLVLVLLRTESISKQIFGAS